jgi:16S rRNA (cytosine1402-N4)-methyltransferase
MHVSVLLHETIEGLSLESGEILIDATFGLGGHSKEACLNVKNIRIIGIDLNADTLYEAQKQLNASGCNIEVIEGNFRNLDKYLDTLSIKDADKYIFDLGWSSAEFEESKRGFSFQRDEPLLMTYKKDAGEEDLTAYEIVNTWDRENIEAILSGYGEERFSGRIAKAIVEKRRHAKINTTFELVSIIEQAVPNFYKRSKIHFATKTFQALRIATNDELESLKEGLSKAFDRLSGKGRIAVISFHSLEDRIVKNFFKNLVKEGKAQLVNKKPIVPTRSEILANRRARSAKLRIIEKNDNDSK